MSDDAKVPLPVAFTCGLCGISDYYIAEHLRFYGDARERAARAAAFREAAEVCETQVGPYMVGDARRVVIERCAAKLRARAEGGA